jgi:uncharacterized phage protein gp47/JayE
VSPTSKTPDQISSQILANLAVTMPGLSCAIGTPERKIIDAVAEAISEAYVDQYLVGSLLDIDTKSGLELEQFVGIFGFGRLQGVAATGTVTVTNTVASTSDQTFQLSTQFYTAPGLSGASTLYYNSTQAVVLTAGNLTCDIPVQCSTVGSAGNVPPDSITFVGSAAGSSSVTNLQAMTGGVDVETDAELRQRFKDTLLRNIAGTSDWYEALCQQNTNVSRVTVFGPTSLYQTQVAVTTSGNWPLSLNQDVKYAWPQMESIFTDLGQETETFYSPVDDYVYNGGSSPTFARVSTGALIGGEIVDLEFQYTTQSSRNDPLNGITNKVDIFVDGVNPFSVTEQTVVASQTLNTTSGSMFNINNFERVGVTSTPVSGHRFMRLGSVPIVSFPSIITVGGTNYVQGTDYWLLQGITLLQGSQQEISGIEWSGSGSPISTGTALTLTYVYNQVPELLNALIAPSKQITTDVLVHQGEFDYLVPCLDIEYDRSYSVSTVNSSITNRLQQLFSQMSFGAQIKLSVITMFVQQTLGVVDVKVTTSGENANYGIQRFHNSADTVSYINEPADFKLDDNMLAVYKGINITRVATP